MQLNTQKIDKFAILISSLCVAHCLIFPLLAVFAPSVITLGLSSENFHYWMVVAVIPSSLFALTLGCKKHANKTVLLIGALGLSCLLLAFALGGNVLGEWGEKSLTLMGAAIIAFSHIKNFKLCQSLKDSQNDSKSENDSGCGC